MGDAAAYHLARRGRRVLGLERFAIPHEQGSSHGLTRIIRLAYFEHPSYVPLLRRAYELWRDLQAEAGEQLLYITGCLEVGYPDGEVIQGSRRACQVHNLRHEEFTAGELMRRIPAYRTACRNGRSAPARRRISGPRALYRFACPAGASAWRRNPYGEQVLGWEPLGDRVRVRTDRATYEADRLVISAGSWAGQLAGVLAGVAVAERQVLGWFETSHPKWYTPENFPVFLLDVPEGRYYGFPMFGIPGLKLGLMHHLRETVDPDQVDREIHPRDEEVLRICLNQLLAVRHRRSFGSKDMPLHEYSG